MYCTNSTRVFRKTSCLVLSEVFVSIFISLYRTFPISNIACSITIILEVHEYLVCSLILICFVFKSSHTRMHIYCAFYRLPTRDNLPPLEEPQGFRERLFQATGLLPYLTLLSELRWWHDMLRSYCLVYFVRYLQKSHLTL